MMIILRSLYGLTTSVARWHEELSSSLRKLGFEPSRADADIWIKDMGTHYEYICICGDDVLLVSNNPVKLIEDLRACGYKLKGVGAPEYYLGGNFGRLKSSLFERESTSFLSANTSRTCVPKSKRLWRPNFETSTCQWILITNLNLMILNCCRQKWGRNIVCSLAVHCVLLLWDALISHIR